MFKCIALLALALASAIHADVPCCNQKERSTSYLDIAVDLILKAKSKMPECTEKEKETCPDAKATDCADWYNRGYHKNGVYTIWPINRVAFNKSLTVFCDMETDGGGWTVLQRRGNFGNPHDYFFKDWTSYKTGFGNVSEDFWLGNDNIFALTNQKSHSVRFDLQAENLTKAYAIYSKFWIDDEFHKYTLHIDGYSGNAGDSMKDHDVCKFSTKDQINQEKEDSCPAIRKVAWWYNSCGPVNLNGLQFTKGYGIYWDSYSPKTAPSLVWTEIKIRSETYVPI